MANNVSSNFARKLLEQFLIDFESTRVLSKAVDTQLFQGKFNPSSGESVDIKRPHRYLATRTSDGDLTGATDNSIISGKATATVQDYITVKIPWSNVDESLKLNQLSEITMPAAQECVTVLETSFAEFMLKNCGLSWGAPDTAVDAWSDIAGPMALMQSLGISEPCNYVMNPYIAANLADTQAGLQSANTDLIGMAWKEAQISNKFAGAKVFTANSLSNYTLGAFADKSGTLSATPTATYVGAKDTMTQSIAVTGFDATATITAGTTLEFPATFFINPRTRTAFIGEDGNPVPFRVQVTADVDLDGSGAGTLVVTGPAIYEADGQYNNVTRAIASGDTITMLGTASTLYQPNLFFTKDSFSIASVKIPKLNATDYNVVTKDGLSIRQTRWSDGNTNEQFMRYDLLPAFGVLNPFKCGLGYGKA